MSELYYKGKVVLFECDRKRCGSKCDITCGLTTDIEHAKEKSGEYDVCPAEAAPDLYYIAVPVKKGKQESKEELS